MYSLLTAAAATCVVYAPGAAPHVDSPLTTPPSNHTAHHSQPGTLGHAAMAAAAEPVIAAVMGWSAAEPQDAKQHAHETRPEIARLEKSRA